MRHPGNVLCRVQCLLVKCLGERLQRSSGLICGHFMPGIGHFQVRKLSSCLELASNLAIDSVFPHLRLVEFV